MFGVYHQTSNLLRGLPKVKLITCAFSLLFPLSLYYLKCRKGKGKGALEVAQQPRKSCFRNSIPVVDALTSSSRLYLLLLQQICDIVFFESHLITDIDWGLVIYNPTLGGGRIQNDMTNILNSPHRARKFFLTPLP